MQTNTKTHIGNTDLLKLHKTAFLCSRKIPASVVLKCYDWAIEQREKGNCVISGFHSQIEKDVLHYLLKGTQPIIIALARGLKHKLEPELQQPFNQGRLLIITPYEATVKRVTEQTATKRNQMMMDLADSSLFFWFFITFSDCRNVNSREILKFPIDVSEMNDDLRKQLSKLAKSLMKDLDKNAVFLNRNDKRAGLLEIQSFQPRTSKPIINKIDTALAKHYGFTDEELDFIINYDIKYRMGKELESEESEP